MKKTILVTDSGLGGLSVFADIVDHVLTTYKPSVTSSTSGPAEKEGSTITAPSATPSTSRSIPAASDSATVSHGAGLADEISMIYFNAWPEESRGYNHFPSKAHQADIFNNAMHAMGKFHPDMILIACNTLSVVYPNTPFSQQTAIPVIGIVDHGVEMIFETLTKTPDSAVIVFGTPTTTNARSHADALIQKGIPEDRIINQGCIDLAGKIERNPFSETVQTMIRENVLQAAGKIKASESRIGRPFSTVYAALCCTHFGYRRELFIKEIKAEITDNVAILNPNERMADRAIAASFSGDVSPSEETPFSPPASQFKTVDLQVVSRVTWGQEKIDAYTRLFQERSPEVVTALLNHELNPGLFSVEPKVQ